MSTETHYTSAIAEIVRSGFVESVHSAVACIRLADGRHVLTAGDAERFTFPRSSLKPLQALAPVSAGVVEAFELTPAETAIFCGSHRGESFHVDAVRSILGKIGLDESALQCGAHWPCEAASEELRSRGEKPTALHNNCSGKHAGMLAYCVKAGLPVTSYLDPAQANQQLNIDNIAAMSSTCRDDILVGIDGCAAPTFGLPVDGMALAFARLGAAEYAPDRLRAACQMITAAMTAHPEMIAGTGQSCTRLIAATEGALVIKDGAEAFFAAAIPDEDMGIAVKVLDGGHRAVVPIALRCLETIGVVSPDNPLEVGDLWSPALTNCRGDIVGQIRARLIE